MKPAIFQGGGGVLVWLSLVLAGPVTGREVTDATARTVRVPDHPRQVLSLCTTVTDTLLRLGAADRFAGIDEHSRLVPGAAKLPVLGKGGSISREQVLARRTDLAFVWWYQDDAARLLAELRVPTLRIRCGRAGEIPAMIRLVGEGVGLSAAAAALARTLAADLERLRAPAGTNAPRVFLELYSPFKTSGRESYLNDLIELAGGRNVAAAAAGSILLSGEQLVQSDPEVVLLVGGFATPEAFARRSGMGALTAVRTGRVHLLDRYDLVAGAGFTQAVTRLRGLLAETSPPKD